MTKEQLITEIMTSMDVVLGANEKAILNSVLVEKLQGIEFKEDYSLATYDNSNEQFIKMFVAIKGSRLSEKTMKLYLSTLRMFMDVINKPLNQVTAIDIEYFLNYKSSTNTETSLNNMRRNLSAFYTFMRKKKFMNYNPCDEVEPFKEIKKPIDHLEVTDMEMLKEGCMKERDRALIETLRSTAMRVGELVNVRICDIDFTTGKIVVYGHKTKKYRVVWLDKVALGYVKKYLFIRGEKYDSENYLFANTKTNEQLTDSSIRKSLATIKRNSGLDRRIYPHLFRKDCATRIVKRGGTIEEAGRYLGHAEQGVTAQHYVSLDDSFTEDIFKKYVAIV